MNGLDIFIIIVISLGLVRGFFRGFIKEVSSIVGVIAGFYGAYTYYQLLANYLNSWIGKWGIYVDIGSFCLIFCAIVSVTAVMAYVIREFLRVVFLGWVDRFFGVIFGAIKGFLVASVVFVVLTTFLPGEPEFITTSTLAPYVAHVSEMATIFVSRELKGDLKIKIERIRKVWEQQKVSVQKAVVERATETVQERATLEKK